MSIYIGTTSLFDAIIDYYCDDFQNSNLKQYLSYL